jgi:hypothetical protein
MPDTTIDRDGIAEMLRSRGFSELDIGVIVYKKPRKSREEHQRAAGFSEEFIELLKKEADGEEE